MRRTALVCLFSGLLLASSAMAGNIKLKAIRFPESLTGTTGPTTPPQEIPLSQVIVFEFTGKPRLPAGVAEGLRIRVDPANTLGQPVNGLAFGTYKVVGNSVIFTPRLPTVALTSSFTTTADVAGNTGLPGLLPDTIYSIDVTVGTVNSVRNLVGIKSGAIIPQTFRTTEIPQEFFGNASLASPKVKSKEIRPKAGSTGIHPNVFHDPAGLFTSIKEKRRPPFKVVFKRPVGTSKANINSGRIRLRAILTPEGVPENLALGATALLTVNSPKRAEVLLYPSGFLPLGHTIALEISDQFASLSGAMANPLTDPVYRELARYEVAVDPQPGTAVDDYIYEDFNDTLHQDTSLDSLVDQLAGWDTNNSDTLRASWGFGGDGSLGRFLPPSVGEVVIFLDTDYQQLPLFSGATPDVRAGTVVRGGVFNFTDFWLPYNCVLVGKGNNPLVITATGDVLIEGEIDLRGGEGASDDTFDSAITALPGGSPSAGGGKGGDGHPVYSPPGATSLIYIQTPQYGQSGYAPGNKGPGGGGGGQSGCSLPFSPLLNGNCANYSPAGDGSRGSGGGGGSYAQFIPSVSGPEPLVPTSGRRGAIGAGDHLPVQFNAGNPIPTVPLVYQAQPGNPSNSVARENDQLTFAEAYLAGMVYDNSTLMNINATWPQERKILLWGDPGPSVFPDGDIENNYIGPGGEISKVMGGQGGGGAGSRTEGLTWDCIDTVMNVWGLPITVLDARGGGGGGGGGAIMIQALGSITISGYYVKIAATGGAGGGGEATTNANKGGGGGGGAGGTVVLQSAVNVYVIAPDIQDGALDVSGGCGKDATKIAPAFVSNGDNKVLQFADGGPGALGLLQIHLPEGAPIEILYNKTFSQHFPDMYNMKCSDSSNLSGLVDLTKTPSPLTPKSKARSTWYDLGAVTSDFRPPIVTTAGALDGPIFGVPGVGPFFRGTNPSTGFVATDSLGNVISPYTNDIEVDAPDLQRADYIPNGMEYPHYQSVEVWFEGADEDSANPGSPDLQTATGFVSDITQLNGKRFIRYEVRFDIATEVGTPASPATPRQEVRMLRVPFKY